MNKIIIVGHPHSNYKKVELLLSKCGMSAALPTKRDNLTPVQISQILLKAHGVEEISKLQRADELKQIEVMPVWQNMSFDLMLSNIDQQLWGWSDTEAIYLLEYWYQQDPSITFVLVYDDPETAHTRLPTEDRRLLTTDRLRLNTQVWTAYNSVLLDFYLSHRDRSLLIHSNQVNSSVYSSLQKLKNHITDSLQVPPEESLLSLMCAEGMDEVNYYENNEELSGLLAKKMIESDLEACQVYEKLQKEATLAHKPKHRQKIGGLDVHSSKPLYEKMWLELSKYELKLEEKQLELGTKNHKICQMNIAVKEQEIKNQKALGEINEFQVSNKKLILEKKLQVQENDLLVNQLHRVQEELEQLYHKDKEQTQLYKVNTKLIDEAKENVNNIKRITLDLANSKKELNKTQDQLNIVSTDLVEALRDKAVSLKLKNENELLLTQLHTVQEELEKIFIEMDLLKNTTSQNQIYYGAADRVKQELAYRLGARMIESSKSISSWFVIPFLFHIEKSRYEKERLLNLEKVKLPSLDQYADKSDIERIKNHLSYRLGVKMIENSNSIKGWVQMPWILYREAKLFKERK
ncbi:hypothetical protein AB8Q18_15010 [Neisseriaceae bacterium CLB008]